MRSRASAGVVGAEIEEAVLEVLCRVVHTSFEELVYQVQKRAPATSEFDVWRVSMKLWNENRGGVLIRANMHQMAREGRVDRDRVAGVE